MLIMLKGQIILTNNIITNNSSDAKGGGVYILGFDSVTLTSNTITGHSSSDSIYDIYVSGSNSGSVTLSSNMITGNSSGGIYGILHITPKVLYTLLEMIPEKLGSCSRKCKLINEGCRIYVIFFESVSLTSNTITNNGDLSIFNVTKNVTFSNNIIKNCGRTRIADDQSNSNIDNVTFFNDNSASFISA